MKKVLFLFILTIFMPFTFAQNENFQIGSEKMIQNSQGAFYDFSDPKSVNIKVGVWGFVRFPGKYVVPEYTNINDLLSYAGGPTENATLDEIKVYRETIGSDTSANFIKFNYNDMLWEKEGEKNFVKPPKLVAGDILLVPGEDRLYFRDYLTMGLSITSTLISLTILIINIAR